MQVHQELKLLKQIQGMRNDDKYYRKLRRFVRICLIVGWLAVCIAFLLAFQAAISASIAVFIASVGGILGGMGLYAHGGMKQWAVIQNHLDPKSLEARVKALESLKP